MINVALPKGRLGETAYETLAAAGYDCPAILEKNRKLTFENLEKGVRYFWVKPSDVSIYVERGAADVGIAGRDILLEYRPDVIVDIVETGKTLLENHLAPLETIVDISARFICNKVSYKFKHQEVLRMRDALEKNL